MFSHTIAALEKFDNQHEFERMSADILNSLGYKNVVLIAPRGGSDCGMDIIFTANDGSQGLACVTLRKDIDAKFKEDFSKRKAGEFSIYILFCTAYLTASQKLRFTQYCLDTLQAEFVPEDIETLRSLLDSTLLPIREKYLYTIASLSWPPDAAEIIADTIVAKLGKGSQVYDFNERIIMDWLIDEAQMCNSKVSVDLGDIPGVKHSIRMTKANKDWEAWYGMWFQQQFIERMGFEPTEESVRYALEKYAEVVE